MLKVRNLSNMYQKRLIRPTLAQTQGYPIPGVLHPSLRNADGSFRAPVATDTQPIARTAAAFTLQGGLVPGTVMLNAGGDQLVVANGANSALQPYGLLANFVGGTLDDIGDENMIGAWRGPDSQYELLAPAWDDTGLAAAYAAAGPGNPVKLFAGTDGRLTATSPGANAIVVAHLVERTSAAKIVIDLKI